jgi:AraC-like DNA-binding protein
MDAIRREFGCNDRRVARVLRLVAQDLSKRVTLRQAASAAGLQPAYFSRRFRAMTGMCFAQWSTRLRIEEAKTLLGIIDLSITAVAAAVGYSDVTTFDRAFRRVERMRPRQFRRVHLALTPALAPSTDA